MLLPLDELLSGSLLAPDRCLLGSYGKSLQSGCFFLLSLLFISWLLLLLQRSRQRLAEADSAASPKHTIYIATFCLTFGAIADNQRCVNRPLQNLASEHPQAVCTVPPGEISITQS